MYTAFFCSLSSRKKVKRVEARKTSGPRLFPALFSLRPNGWRSERSLWTLDYAVKRKNAFRKNCMAERNFPLDKLIARTTFKSLLERPHCEFSQKSNYCKNDYYVGWIEENSWPATQTTKLITVKKSRLAFIRSPFFARRQALPFFEQTTRYILR